jgi:hypothetical protein
LVAQPLLGASSLLKQRLHVAQFLPTLGDAMMRITSASRRRESRSHLLHRGSALWCREKQVDACLRLFGTFAGLNRRYVTVYQFKRMHHFTDQSPIAPAKLADCVEKLLAAPLPEAFAMLHTLEGAVLALVAKRVTVDGSADASMARARWPRRCWPSLRSSFDVKRCQIRRHGARPAAFQLFEFFVGAFRDLNPVRRIHVVVAPRTVGLTCLIACDGRGMVQAQALGELRQRRRWVFAGQHVSLPDGLGQHGGRQGADTLPTFARERFVDHDQVAQQLGGLAGLLCQQARAQLGTQICLRALQTRSSASLDEHNVRLTTAPLQRHGPAQCALEPLQRIGCTLALQPCAPLLQGQADRILGWGLLPAHAVIGSIWTSVRDGAKGSGGFVDRKLAIHTGSRRAAVQEGRCSGAVMNDAVRCAVSAQKTSAVLVVDAVAAAPVSRVARGRRGAVAAPPSGLETGVRGRDVEDRSVFLEAGLIVET